MSDRLGALAVGPLVPFVLLPPGPRMHGAYPCLRQAIALGCWGLLGDRGGGIPSSPLPPLVALALNGVWVRVRVRVRFRARARARNRLPLSLALTLTLTLPDAVPSSSSPPPSAAAAAAAAAAFLLFPAEPCLPYKDAASSEASSRCGALRARPLEVNAGGDGGRACACLATPCFSAAVSTGRRLAAA